ncbi:MAG: hypothetical protein H7256_15090 [Bdellovibrio sp.]|nr:hypothetical protein [Bdellovibrio sp.]
MKRLALTLLFAPLCAFAQQSSSVCTPISDSSLDAGQGDLISQVKSLQIVDSKMDGSFTTKLVVKGMLGIEVANRDETEKEHVELYTVKERKDGMMFELQGDKKNSFDFTSVMFQFGSPEVQTAGPIPPGTYNQVVSLAFIDSNLYYKNASPMTVKKIAFQCKTTYSY